MKCTSALLHCTSLINEPRIVDALLPNDSAVEPESATEQAETSAGPTVLLIEIRGFIHFFAKRVMARHD